MARPRDAAPSLLARLERLRLLARRLYAHKLPHQPLRRASSGVFRDRRAYQPGDDWRSVDWPVYARSERLLTRLFDERGELEVTLLLDCSASMASATGRKMEAARELVVALAYLALAQGDRVRVVPFDREVRPQLPLVRGRGQIARVLQFVSEQLPQDATALSQVLERVPHLCPRRGRVVLVSDLWAGPEALEGLRKLRPAGLDPLVIQVLGRADREAPAGCGGTLEDRETGRQLRRGLGPTTRAHYSAAVSAWTGRLGEQLLRMGVARVLHRAEKPLEAAITEVFRTGRFLP